MIAVKHYFELNGEALALAVAFFNEIDNTQALAFEVARAFGAKGFRPYPERGGIQSLIFPLDTPLPTGWIEAGRSVQGVEARPRRKSKAEKTLLEACRVEGVNRTTHRTPADLVAQLGYSRGDFVISGFSIHFPTATRLLLPSPRYLVQVPAYQDEGVQLMAGCIEIRESQYLAAYEAHNDAVKALQDAAKEKAA